MKNSILSHVDRARASLAASREHDGSNEQYVRDLRNAAEQLAAALVGVADHVRAHQEAADE